jgi:hypothetical protein
LHYFGSHTIESRRKICNRHPPAPVLPSESEKQEQEPTMSMDFDSDAVPLAAMLVPIVGSIALFSFLAVAAWAEARRKEREAYYMGETLKKIAESSGEGARTAMELLREQERT